jgi:hypothetical protein
MSYVYAYQYPIRSGMTGAIAYRNQQFQTYQARVLADGGIIQYPDYVQQWYQLDYELGVLATGGFTGLGWRRKYNAMAGVKLNNIAGTDYVQTMYDLNNASPVDALQTTAANQPLWGTDASLPSGIRAPIYDGSNDFMSINDLGIFNAQAAGTVIASVKDLNRTGGDTAHFAVNITTATGTGRAGLLTRSGTNIFSVAGRRLDADSASVSTVASQDGLNLIQGLYVWGGNLIQGVFNGIAAASATFASGAGLTSATDSTLYHLGSVSGSTNRLNGLITDHTAGRIVATTAQLASLRALEKSFYPALP